VIDHKRGLCCCNYEGNKAASLGEKEKAATFPRKGQIRQSPLRIVRKCYFKVNSGSTAPVMQALLAN
jgi:hypothetical protein